MRSANIDCLFNKQQESSFRVRSSKQRLPSRPRLSGDTERGENEKSAQCEYGWLFEQSVKCARPVAEEVLVLSSERKMRLCCNPSARTFPGADSNRGKSYSRWPGGVKLDGRTAPEKCLGRESGDGRDKKGRPVAPDRPFEGEYARIATDRYTCCSPCSCQ